MYYFLLFISKYEKKKKLLSISHWLINFKMFREEARKECGFFSNKTKTLSPNPRSFPIINATTKPKAKRHQTHQWSQKTLLRRAQKPHTSGGDTAVKLRKLASKLPNSACTGGAPDGFGSYADNDDGDAGISCREEKEVAHGIGEMQWRLERA